MQETCAAIVIDLDVIPKASSVQDSVTCQAPLTPQERLLIDDSNALHLSTFVVLPALVSIFVISLLITLRSITEEQLQKSGNLKLIIVQLTYLHTTSFKRPCQSMSQPHSDEHNGSTTFPFIRSFE